MNLEDRINELEAKLDTALDLIQFLVEQEEQREKIRKIKQVEYRGLLTLNRNPGDWKALNTTAG